MNIGVLITVRSKSTRLPEKCFRTIIPGYSLLEYNIQNAKKIFEKENIIVATTTQPEDDLIEDICNFHNIKVFRGSIKNKIDRWEKAARVLKCDVILPYDGDDPFTDLNIGRKCAEKLINENLCLVKAINLPCGCFTYAIRAESLKRINKNFDTSDSEMMWVFFENDQETKYGEYNCKFINPNKDINNLRVTVDYQEDLNVARKIAKIIKEESLDINADTIYKIWLREPEIFQENDYLQQDYLNNQSDIISKMN